MIAPHPTAETAPKSAPRPIPQEVLYEPPAPSRTLADLYRRCSPKGGCPYNLDQITRVLTALRDRGAVVATEISSSVSLPASAVYGCVLELEDFGLCRWIPEPVTSAEYITAEITAHGLRFLREIHPLSGARYAAG